MVYKKRGKVLYVQVLGAIYAMLEWALLMYRKLCGRLEEVGFKFNPYNPCVVKRQQKESQQTTLFHVENLTSSHKDPQVNDQFNEWLQKKYGEHGKVTTHHGKMHEYLGMELDYTKDGKVKNGMIKYVEDILKEFHINSKAQIKQLCQQVTGDGLFNQGQGKKLETEHTDTYHTMVAKGLFLCKHA